jgi:hypothetical protein
MTSPDTISDANFPKSLPDELWGCLLTMRFARAFVEERCLIVAISHRLTAKCKTGSRCSIVRNVE